jgi:hypothetical protein
METQGDPRTYFKFKSCSRCLNKPCDQLRFGGIYPGKFILARCETLEPALSDCPFLAHDPDEIENLIGQCPIEEVYDRIDYILQAFTPEELEYFGQLDFMSDIGESAGMILFIKELCETRAVNFFRIPQLFRNDAAIRKWLFAY